MKLLLVLPYLFTLAVCPALASESDMQAEALPPGHTMLFRKHVSDGRIIEVVRWRSPEALERVTARLTAWNEERKDTARWGIPDEVYEGVFRLIDPVNHTIQVFHRVEEQVLSGQVPSWRWVVFDVHISEGSALVLSKEHGSTSIVCLPMDGPREPASQYRALCLYQDSQIMPKFITQGEIRVSDDGNIQIAIYNAALSPPQILTARLEDIFAHPDYHYSIETPPQRADKLPKMINE